MPLFHCMAESTLLLALLTISTLCLVAITIAILLTSRELRQTLRRVNALLPRADRALQEVHRLLTTVNTAAGHVETMMQRVRHAMSTTLEHVQGWTSQVERLWVNRFGNGAGAASRHQHRRR